MINIKRILCPTDLSPHSEGAVRYALALSRAHEAELILLHCTDDADGGYKLASSVSEYLDRSDSKWRFVIASAEDVDEKIITQAEAAHADLIVMRSRRRPHRAALLGSTAESVCRNAPCPVLVMHHDQREFVNNELRVDLKRVLVAYDFSDYSELGL
jgi:nucleotide-binding universal stress UspA family protein